MHGGFGGGGEGDVAHEGTKKNEGEFDHGKDGKNHQRITGRKNAGKKICEREIGGRGGYRGAAIRGNEPRKQKGVLMSSQIGREEIKNVKRNSDSKQGGERGFKKKRNSSKRQETAGELHRGVNLREKKR